ncbi:MAG: hypothetical protein HYZ11_08240 [Candidatus Tectomicrobia bacterium]|uniref:Uncharacterized protein n=1 Tax=Tectimicrobiota bacterium TaxID=2528274 RepID=A0A932HXU0_UNCTE|nr:hypothetical protein [Candidatus Tectomicrobia bacterium]
MDPKTCRKRLHLALRTISQDTLVKHAGLRLNFGPNDLTDVKLTPAPKGSEGINFGSFQQAMAAAVDALTEEALGKGRSVSLTFADGKVATEIL